MHQSLRCGPHHGSHEQLANQVRQQPLHGHVQASLGAPAHEQNVHATLQVHRRTERRQH